jgi:hypothetical protein
MLSFVQVCNVPNRATVVVTLCATLLTFCTKRCKTKIANRQDLPSTCHAAYIVALSATSGFTDVIDYSLSYDSECKMSIAPVPILVTHPNPMAVLTLFVASTSLTAADLTKVSKLSSNVALENGPVACFAMPNLDTGVIVPRMHM